ncbi:hypothetical protein BH11VER1_BH11VER1_00610 [soil metagenome]
MPEKIAVIIPCYNHARYIGEALESVLSQTRKPDRIIVIDDGSKDESMDVIRTFESRGVEVHAQTNQGAHNAINQLVNMAAKDCDFISILNSDDRYAPDRMQQCLDLAREQPGKAVYVTGLRVIDDKGNVMPKDAPRARWFHGAWSLGQEEGIGVPEWLGQANFIATTSNVFARSTYLKANPFRPYRFNHDYFFLSTAALENMIAVRPEVLIDYRVHGSNTIATKPEPLIREMIRMHLDLYHKHAEALAQNKEMRKRFYAFTRSAWENISSFHAGLMQVALARLVSTTTEEDREKLSNYLSGPEFDEFPNKVLAGAFDGKTSLSSGGALSKRVESLQSDLDQVKKDREALDKLARYRQHMLRSGWVKFGLLLGLARPLISNRGKTPHEKMLWLRGVCATHWWLKLGEKLGSRSSSELRRNFE